MRASSAGLGLFAALLAVSAVTGEPQPRKPMYVMLVSTYEDHINLDASEQRLHRTLPVLASLRREYPTSGISCLYQFTGASAASLKERRSNGLLDQLLRALREGYVEVGYDGTEEPAFVARPRPDLRARRTPEDRWAARARAYELFLSEGKHPRTGEPVEGEPGGVALVRDVFGAPRAVWGASLELGCDSELVNELRHLDVDAVLPGIPTRDSFPARNLPGVRGAAAMLGRQFGAVEDGAPEVFWQDHALRISDFTVEGTGPVVAHKGVEAFEALLQKLDPSVPHVVRVRLGDPGLYAKRGFGRRNYLTPLDYAYDNPKDAALPDEALLSPAEVDAAYAREAALLRWLVTDFFPASPGSGFLSVSRLREMAGLDHGFTLSGAAVRAAALEFVTTWKAQGPPPPSYVTVEGHDLSLADVFGVFAEALDGRARHGNVPDLLTVRRVLGPFEIGGDGAHAGRRVAVGAVALAASALLPRLADGTWRPLPANVIPSEVTVADVTVTAAQFLRLMAEALVATDPETEVAIVTVSPMSPLGLSLPRTRRIDESGNVWTLKPARLRPRSVT